MFGLDAIYRFLAPLGRGGEGEVFLVEDLYRGGQLEALKVVPLTGREPPREFRELAQLRHPGIARVVDTGLIDDPPARYFTTEYFSGVPLTQIPAPISWELLTELVARACEALAYLHDRGLRHGDLKPAHILFRDAPSIQLRLIDLGHVAAIAADSAAGYGTPPYVAPEIWSGGRAGAGADLYALGMVLLETLRGSLPLRGASHDEWRAWHEDADRARVIDDIAVDVPDSVARLVRDLLAPEPSSRPRDGAAVLSRLGRTVSYAAGAIPLLGREGVLADFGRWLEGDTDDVRFLVGPHGVGKTRVLGAIGRVARARGYRVVQAAAPGAGEIEAMRFAALVRRGLGSGRRRLLLVDDADAASPEALRSLWAELRHDLGETSPAAVLALSGDAARWIRGFGEPSAPVEHLGPLARDAAEELAERVLPRGDEARRRRVIEDSRGIPGAIVSCGGEASADAVAGRPLAGELHALLAALPTALPVLVVRQTLGWSDERFWRELAGATPAPVIEGAQPDLRVHPLPDEGAPTAPAEVLRTAARAWRESGDDDGDWGAVVLDLMAGVPTSEAAILRQFEELQDRRRWRSLAAFAEHPAVTAVDAVGSRRHWFLMEAWSHVGRVRDAAQLLDELVVDTRSLEELDSDRAVLAAELLDRSGEPQRRLPFLRHAARAARDSRRRFELTAETLRAALALGEREEAQALVASIREHDGLAPARISEMGSGAAEKLAGLFQQLGHYDDAERLYEGALGRARVAGQESLPTVLACLSGLAGAARRRNDVAGAEHLLRLGVRYAALAGRPEEGRVLQANLAAVRYHDNRPEDALATYRELQQAVRREGNQRLLPFASLGVGTIQRERGELIGALVTLRRAAREARDVGNEAALANILSNLGEVYLLIGDPAASYAVRREVLKLSRRMANHSLICQARAALGASLCRLGRLAEARCMLDRALAMQGGDVGLRIEASIHAYVAEAEWIGGNVDAALRSWAACCRTALRSGRVAYACRAIAGMARCLEVSGNHRRSATLFERAEVLAGRDAAAPLTRSMLAWERWTSRLRREGWNDALATGFRDLYSAVLGHGLRELAAGCALVLHRHGHALPPAAERVVDGLLRRLDVGSMEALSRRLEVVDVSTWARQRRAREALPTDLEREASPLLRELDGLRDHWCANTARLLVEGSVGGEPAWHEHATVREGDAELRDPPRPRPGFVAAESAGASDRAVRVASDVHVPLRMPSDAVNVVVLLEGDRITAPRRQPLAALERAVAAALLPFLEGRHDAELRRLRGQLDRMRQQSLLDKERMETEILTQRLQLRRIGETLEHLRGSAEDAPPWVARAPAMLAIERHLEAWAKSDLAVLIVGENGTGKNTLARRVHEASSRRDQVLLVENCSALPGELLETELFGFRRGSFTGAEQDRSGLLERADGGTLVLDHVDELPRDLQGKLLRFLETGRYRSVGSGEESSCDVRVIATTRRLPEAALAERVMRRDLYYRLQGVEIRIPPLTERVAEIGPLIECHLRWHAARLSMPAPAIDEGAMAALERRAWPGNVREVSNLVQRWLILQKRTITRADVPDEPEGEVPEPMAEAGTPWREAMHAYQRRYLKACLERYDGNQKRTAEALGLSRRHLQNLLDKLDLRREGVKKSSRSTPGV